VTFSKETQLAIEEQFIRGMIYFHLTIMFPSKSNLIETKSENLLEKYTFFCYPEKKFIAMFIYQHIGGITYHKT